jgi:diphthamide synthase (EF-2-diphthine--ammonia ligase)
MVLLAFLVGLAAFLAGLAFCIVRGVQLWRQARLTGRTFSTEVARFEERSLRTEQLLAENERATEELRAALERLRADRARLQVLTGAIERARQRTRWLRAYLPAR